jgi:hypothetical protein
VPKAISVILFLVILALAAVGLGVELARPRDLDDRDRRPSWPGAARS